MHANRNEQEIVKFDINQFHTNCCSSLRSVHTYVKVFRHGAPVYADSVIRAILNSLLRGWWHYYCEQCLLTDVHAPVGTRINLAATTR